MKIIYGLAECCALDYQSDLAYRYISGINEFLLLLCSFFVSLVRLKNEFHFDTVDGVWNRRWR